MEKHLDGQGSPNMFIWQVMIIIIRVIIIIIIIQTVDSQLHMARHIDGHGTPNISIY